MISREEAISKLRRIWRTQELKFYAEFFRPKKDDGSLIKPRPGVQAFGFFRNFSINDHKIFYPTDEILKYDRNISFKINVVNGLEDGKYYLLELELEDDKNRIENPYALKIKDISILEEDHLSPKEFINQWFYKKGHTPDDASTIAGQLTLNELELYTHTKRFIFELIQNADDMPFGNNVVNIEIQLLQNHLLFLHNGKYFDRYDVKAISDAAKSTKSKSLSQTGYKGIGFKSVFTDSTRVYIKSGDYFFKFDKLEPIYLDFYLLYKGYTDSLSPKARKEFEKEFKGKEEEYTNIDKIPWQIKPIWVEQITIPNELSTSQFSKNQQVSIALEIGESILRQKDYHGMILGLLKEPRFLIFLRNTKGFKYKVNNSESNELLIDVSVKERNNSIGVYGNDELIASYLKHEFTININNEDFAKAGLNFQKREIEGGKIEFFDDDGRKLDNIPEKLGRLDKTIISLSAKVDKYAIVKLEKEDSILFNYLPTSDQRFGFPFLVNADFVTKTDREFIQIENKWNHYIFYHLGKKCIEWIAKLGRITHEINEKHLFSYVKTYLNLLPDDFLDEENEELSSINIAFNNGLKDAIQETSFILDNNRKLKKCDEIIIDDTIISNVLGNSFFKEVSKSKKELPFFILNKTCLTKGYLNIERYNADTLQKELTEESNKLILIRTLLILRSEKYLEFLIWLDNFCKINDVEINWLLELPSIRLKDAIVSLNEALNKSDFHFKIIKTKDLEKILQKIGFELSEFYLDDENYRHINGAILQQDSYLKTDVKLYDHIAAAKDLWKLTSREKNSLLTFFESLDDVGKAKYAKSLPLFKSKKLNGALKPLNTLISNTCKNLPGWLSDHIIDYQEEIALTDAFKKHLIKQSDLLKEVFCNLATYNEIITGLSATSILEFYTYLLRLQKEKPEETKIDYSQIPWVYIPSSNSFAMPTNIYWPDSITKLSVDKYVNVKAIIENVSIEKLPHYAALQLKATFALGSKPAKFTDLLTKVGTFTVLPINDFLDWLQLNGETDFFTKFSISKENEEYGIILSGGILQYYSADEALNSFIAASSLNANLTLLPTEVYEDGRKNIGLLEGNNLLKYLLENGLAVPSFINFVQLAKNTELSLQYLTLLDTINIDTSKTYDSKSNEFKIIKLAIEHVISDQEKLKTFRNKLTIDNLPLLDRAISDDVRFYQLGGKTIELKTKLKDILESYTDKVYSITEIINTFIDFKDDKNLIALFKTESRTISKILKELNELKVDYYNPAQTFFLSFYKSLHSEEDVFKNKSLFTINYSTNLSLFEKDMHKFLDICMKEDNYIGFLGQITIPDFNPSHIVLNEEYSIDTEKPSKVLLDWINASDAENKKAYLKLLGINEDSSPVVLLRKAIKQGQQDMDIARGSLNNKVLFKNTFEWLYKNSSQCKSKLNGDLLKPLYAKSAQLLLTVSEIYLPILYQLEDINYILEKHDNTKEYHSYTSTWGEYQNAIFDYTKQVGIRVITDILPSVYQTSIKLKITSPIEELNRELINSTIEDFKEKYYHTWPEKAQFPIKIFKGSKIPYKITYNSGLIKNIEKEKFRKVDNYYLISVDLIKAIPDSIKELMQPALYNSLIAHIKQFNDSLKNISYNDEQIAALKKFLADDEIPDSYRKNLNLAALVSALVALPQMGYDVEQANNNLGNTHEFAQLYPIYKGDVVYTIMCRSARQGLLYMTAKSWNRLGDDNVLLFVDTGHDNYKLFYSKQDILNANEKVTDYQILRIESEANAENIESILNGSFDKMDKIWIIFRIKENKAYDSLYYKKLEPENSGRNNGSVRTDFSDISEY